MMKLDEKLRRVVQAALLELDAKWREGTANANFKHERTLRLLRGEAGIHESDVLFFFEQIEKGAIRFQIGYQEAAPQLELVATVDHVSASWGSGMQHPTVIVTHSADVSKLTKGAKLFVLQKDS